MFPNIAIVGGAAIPVLEGWVLAMLGEAGTERLGKAAAQSELVEKGIARRDTGAIDIPDLHELRGAESERILTYAKYEVR